MPRLSFRFKLLFAMMLVVGAVSGVTLYLTQMRVQAAYEKLFKDKLESQITYIPREQELRIGNIKSECERLAKSVRVIAALNEHDAKQLYDVGRDELKIILRTEEELSTGDTNTPPVKPVSPAAPGTPTAPVAPAVSPGPVPELKAKQLERLAVKMAEAPKAAERLAAKMAESQIQKKGGGRPVTPPPLKKMPYLGFLDAEGKVVPIPEKAQQLSPDRLRFHERLAHFGPVISKLETQQVGYLDLGADRLTEVIVTPVRDDGQLIGAMVYGIQFFDIASAATEKVISDVSDIESGTWLEGKLYTRTIPTEVRDELVRQLDAEIRARTDPRDDFIIRLHDIPHRVFYTALNEGSLLPVAYKIGLYSWESALKAQQELRTQILTFSGAALVGALLVSLVLAHGLSVPIRELVGGTEQISRGNFAIQVPVRGLDDLGKLAQSFNEMAAGLALKEKYYSILHTIADKDVAQQLLDGKIALGGELREATVMFCDIRGFTALTQNMNPTEVIALLNEHMTALTGVVTEHHGVVDKFIGDSIMAIFGAPKSYGDDALNAVRCAEQMMAVRARLNQTSHYQIQMGIGIASGRVLAGNMGSADRSNYTVLGEKVNLAARLCSIARRGEIVLGPTTREQLADRITVEEMDPLQLKGFSDSVVAFKLVEVRADRQPAGQPASQPA
ncbi:MAG: HAMP domain-containing protein [Proteobacteria bacterium]|nr:HAMP domain-containing protein [Pseudomonadota bacterium]